jgi:twitching motility protein PilT
LPTNLPTIDELLADAVARKASDLHLKPGIPPMLRINGILVAVPDPIMTDASVGSYLDAIIPDRLRVDFKERQEADFAYELPSGDRFRVNAFRQRGRVTVAIRALRSPDGDFDSLGLPPVVERMASELRGLVLVTGPTGAGKSTTLSAIVDRINRTRRVNIITIEDPIEVTHSDKMAMVSQREVGVDTGGFGEAMRRVLRQDPDVILVGEMRDAETIDAALKAAETGHLVLSTLHTMDAAETINRILEFFDGSRQVQVRRLLAGSLKAIISQRLLPTADGRGRVPAVEILINTERAAERIANPETTHELIEVIAEGAYYGMETFDQSLLRLAGAGVVTFDEALRHATNPADLKLRAQQLGLVGTR